MDIVESTLIVVACNETNTRQMLLNLYWQLSLYLYWQLSLKLYSSCPATCTASCHYLYGQLSLKLYSSCHYLNCQTV